jgi:hypothetical protein
LYSRTVGALLPTGGNVTTQRIAVDVALMKTSRGVSESCAQTKDWFMIKRVVVRQFNVIPGTFD